MLQHMKQKHKKFYVKYCTQHKIKMNLAENDEHEPKSLHDDDSKIMDEE
jgi:hypothetical protein